MAVENFIRRRMRYWVGRIPHAAAVLLFSFIMGWGAHASPVIDDKTGLPIGSELDEDAIDNPREVFHSETLHGHKSY